MCDCLTINYEVVDKRNHKGISVEIFHRFLNKYMTIASNDKDTVGIFTKTGITAAYVWDSALIDGTKIIYIMPIIGRKLRFPLNVNLIPLPILSRNQSDSVVEYLCLADSSKIFATSIL